MKNDTYKTGCRLLVHTEYGIILTQTDDPKEISAAIEAIGAVREESRKGLDSRIGKVK